MKVHFSSMILALALVCGAFPQTVLATPFMRVFGPVAPPSGYVRFCDHHQADCFSLRPTSRDRVTLSPLKRLELDAVNLHVNRTVAPATDADNYGRIEYWTYPFRGSGDCEDYALLKRRILMQRGWPASALLLTVVRDERGEGHAVLTVRTKQGDYVMDNRRHEIRRWNKSGYSFIKRQSYLNPRVWVALDPLVAKYSVRPAFVMAE